MHISAAINFINEKLDLFIIISGTDAMFFAYLVVVCLKF